MTLMPLTTLLANVNGASFWMPPRASTAAFDADWLFYFILAICTFFTVLVTAVMILFVLKYRQRAGKPAPGKAAGHSTALEVTWTVIPVIIVIVIFFYGFRGYLDQAVIPPNAINVNVTARMWNWQFEYPNGGISDVLYVPVDRPVQFTLISEDAIHSMFIPAFRLKRDVVPGRYNKFWVEATQLGTYPLMCTEYCGTQHSKMGTTVEVMKEADWEQKMEEVADIFNEIDPVTGEPVARPLEDVGSALYTGRGCAQCHSLSGERLIGPSWKNLWGAERQFVDGSTAVADENYISSSILYPQQQVVAGYGGVMPSYLGSLNQREIGAIIVYMKSLSDGYKAGPDGDAAGSRGQDGQPDANGVTGVGGPRSEGNP